MHQFDCAVFVSGTSIPIAWCDESMQMSLQCPRDISVRRNVHTKAFRLWLFQQFYGPPPPTRQLFWLHFMPNDPLYNSFPFLLPLLRTLKRSPKRMKFMAWKFLIGKTVEFSLLLCAHRGAADGLLVESKFALSRESFGLDFQFIRKYISEIFSLAVKVAVARTDTKRFVERFKFISAQLEHQSLYHKWQRNHFRHFQRS